MNKRILAVAVAGALAAPVAAFAQSSVTISGLLKGGFESLKYSNTPAPGRQNSSQSGVVDDSSRLIFNVVEDLGGGMQAIGQWDFRPTIDGGVSNNGSGAFGAVGNNHVGLRSKTWGRIFIGRQDLHYFNRESDLTTKASLRADSISILAYAGGGGNAIANATRTPNVVHYTTPNWGGFTVIAAYSSNPAGAAEGDITGITAVPLAGTRHGRAWNINPNFQAANWQIGYSYWSSKNDIFSAAAAATAGNGCTLGATGALSCALLDQRSDRIYGSYRFGMGLKIGLAYDNSRMKGAFNGTTYSKRNAWSLPIEYSWGPHNIYFHYDRAGADKSDSTVAGTVQNLNGNTDSKSRMWALAYAYDLSKRTSVAVEYAQINNGAGAQYTFFTSASLGLAGASFPVFGEKPRMWGVTMRHQF